MSGNQARVAVVPWHMRNRIIALSIAIVAVAGAAVAAAVSNDSDDQPGTAVARAGESAVVGGLDSDERTVAGAGAARAAPEAGIVAAPAGPTGLADVGPTKVVRTATLEVELERGTFRHRFDAAARIASAHGGFVATSTSERVGKDGAAGSLTLRIPSAAFDAVRRELGALGTLKGETLTGEDVTRQLVDLGARLRSLRAQEEALQAIMRKATTVGDTLQVQEQLTRIRMEIEQLAAQEAGLNDAVSMSTVTVRLAEPGAASAPAAEGDRSILARSWDTATHAVLAELGGMVVVVAALVPLAALGAAGWGLWTLARRRREPAVV